MTLADTLRQKFFTFYQAQGHHLLPSASLIPENDSTTLFTSSGMQPLVPYLLGETHPHGQRLCNSQQCFRAVDLDEVGDARHTTFFEMLGNWSLGDYFKAEQLEFIFTFLTQEIGLDPHKLFVTVFAGDEQLKISRDDESIAIWQKLFAQVGIQAQLNERIFTYDATKNWWSRSGTPPQMTIGEPGGTDSEIFYDFGADLQLHEHSPWKDQPCHPNCDCGRYLEIGNSVFMEFQKISESEFTPLPQKNVDFGGGLERLVMAKENQNDIFLTSIFQPLITKLTQALDFTYQSADPEQKKSLRIIADHLRSAIILLSEGVLPSNKEQGYVLRRLIRKSLVKAHLLSLPASNLSTLVEPMLELYGEIFPRLKTQKDHLITELNKEINKFSQTLKKGLKEINKLTTIDGEKAFHLYETYGFPFELTKEILAEKNLHLRDEDFLAAKKQHQENSKLKSAAKFKGGLADHAEITVKYHTASHLLLAALRKHLDPNIEQKGSNITHERARFDFTFDRALTPDEVQLVETTINQWVQADVEMIKKNYPKQEALDLVGGSVFADRYPDTVSVYSLAGISNEICIGPHVQRTGEIGKLTLGKQQSASHGVRRIYMYMEK